jgi:hypothetical protein
MNLLAEGILQLSAKDCDSSSGTVAELGHTLREFVVADALTI